MQRPAQPQSKLADGDFFRSLLERNRFNLKRFRSSILVEHDLFGKPVSITGSSPVAGFFRIML
jgi:hypothetical protein